MREGAFVSIAGKGRIPALVLFIIALAGCQQAPTGPQPLTDADKDQITALRETFEKAFLANDVSALTALYTKDAMMMSPNAELVRGKADIQKLFEGVSGQEGELTGYTETPVEVFGEGRVAYEVKTIILTGKPPGSETSITIKSKTLWVLRKQDDGTWKIAVDIWNGDQPLPAPGQGESASGN